jgi:hypothetical protein
VDINFGKLAISQSRELANTGFKMEHKKGKIVLMGSGELTSTMVEVHKGLLNQLQESPQAAFLDTPAGFQLNVDQISGKAAEYFRIHVQQPMVISSFKSHETITDFEAQQAFHILRNSNYVLIGPGSPTYAVRQLKESPVPEILTQCVVKGGCLVAASAAALTVGRFTLPVYEIYKVGHDLHWVDGMDILGQFGFDLIVIPHWNNAEGGTHDTRFCFMGEPRFRSLESLIPQKTPILGLDEHTACILDFEKNHAEIKGIGRVTLRTPEGELSFNTGDRLPWMFYVAGTPIPAGSRIQLKPEHRKKTLPKNRIRFGIKFIFWRIAFIKVLKNTSPENPPMLYWSWTARSGKPSGIWKVKNISVRLGIPSVISSF